MPQTQFSIAYLAKPGEEYLTQFDYANGDPKFADRATAEAALATEYGKKYNLRFHYGDLEYAGRKVTSEEFGLYVARTRQYHNTARGGAVFGTPKTT